MRLLETVAARRTALVLVLALGITAYLALDNRSEDHGRVVVTETSTTILDAVEFEPGTATLRPTSRPTLDAVADTLRGNPGIQLVEVQSHTRTPAQALSDQRAAVVMQYLVAAGVEPARLVAVGYSDTQPIDRAAPAKNERISFLILERSGDSDF